MNNTIYDIKNESDTSMVIQYFDFDFIVNIIEDNLIRRINIYQPTLPNIIAAIEHSFKITYNTDEVRTLYSNEMIERRNDIYRKIIKLLCNRHDLVFNENENTDTYSLAYYLYDFLVANFKQYMIDFFATYIHKEKNEIYNFFNLNEYKKNKDSSTLYGKKLYNNQKIAIINANLEYIIQGMDGFDISIEDILGVIYGNKNTINFILSNINFDDNFYKKVYMGVLSDNFINQALITDIRLALHQIERSLMETK